MREIEPNISENHRVSLAKLMKRMRAFVESIFDKMASAGKDPDMLKSEEDDVLVPVVGPGGGAPDTFGFRG